MVVLELVHILVVERDGITVCVTDGVHDGGVADAVAVTIDHLHISVSLRVVDHTHWHIEVNLLLLEVIADGGLDVEIAVLGEGEA